jgi:peptide deformylase
MLAAAPKHTMAAMARARRVNIGILSLSVLLPPSWPFAAPVRKSPARGAGVSAGSSAAPRSGRRTIDRDAPSPVNRRMAVRPIIVLPDPRLRRVSDPVKTIDAGIRELVADMFDTMYDAPGIGLAAIQVGVPQRVVTIDVAKKDEPRAPQVFINPQLVEDSNESSVYEEGCLSIPEIHEDVERPARVRVRYLDLDGKPQELTAEGLLATCIQHEIDHLNGVLFIDHISKLKRDRIVKKFIKAAKRAAE